MKVNLICFGGPSKTFRKYETNLETDPDPQELERLVENSGILELSPDSDLYRFANEAYHKSLEKYKISVELESNELRPCKISVIYDQTTLINPIRALVSYLQNPDYLTYTSS